MSLSPRPHRFGPVTKSRHRQSARTEDWRPDSSACGHARGGRRYTNRSRAVHVALSLPLWGCLSLVLLPVERYYILQCLVSSRGSPKVVIGRKEIGDVRALDLVSVVAGKGFGSVNGWRIFTRKRQQPCPVVNGRVPQCMGVPPLRRDAALSAEGREAFVARSILFASTTRLIGRGN